MQNRGFTLIEVLVATALASVALIGTFFLLQGSFRQSQVVTDSAEFEQVFLSSRNCILTQDIPSLSGTTRSVSYRATGCAIGTYSSDFSFSGIVLGRSLQDMPTANKSYYSYFSVAPGTNSGQYLIEHYLVSDTQKGERDYEVYR